MYDICCVGHITLDKIVTPGRQVEMPGGTSYYFSNAIRQMDVRYLLVTAVAPSEKRFVEMLNSQGIEIKAFDSEQTVCFENIYREDMDHREQKVWAQSDPFHTAQLEGTEARIFHLGPLLAGDIPGDLIRFLSEKGIVSMDAQGFLREVREHAVYPVDWPAKKELLAYVDVLKANEEEMHVLTGEKDIRKGAAILASWGVKEVLITLGSKGSVILTNDQYYDIPAFINGPAIDATGCGDTYMAGYLYQRAKGVAPDQAAVFASAMAGLKVMASGPFTGTEVDVERMIDNNSN
ncbi:PfkB family carbohydrate kinase [Terrimonas sp. NA20]|uniref:PfkB family carbohydrate kinase n=1 Tax=Terrimonas ginsenosidimutans TaxID=2908004 RepID=A0ABS9L0C9_9BACT|nr:PfkB family carbohydrate kinase [Terrimonas ginsenosidimutans]MCG2618000.1 PfkB family carbohydrate kinase [Terrimonas ginsenosidimutans]